MLTLFFKREKRAVCFHSFVKRVKCFETFDQVTREEGAQGQSYAIAKQAIRSKYSTLCRETVQLYLYARCNGVIYKIKNTPFIRNNRWSSIQNFIISAIKIQDLVDGNNNDRVNFCCHYAGFHYVYASFVFFLVLFFLSGHVNC